MFCPACGQEILSNAKFCPQCGGKVGGEKATPQSAPPKVPPKEPSVKPPRSCGYKVLNVIGWFIIFSLILGFISYAIDTSKTVENKNETIGTIWAVFIGIFFLALLWRARSYLVRLIGYAVKVVKYLIHRPRLGIASLAALIILIIFTNWGYHYLNYKSSAKILPAIQDSLADAAAGKIMGDAMMAGQPANTWWGKIAETSKGVGETLAETRVPRLINNYKKSAAAWAADIATAANNTYTWKDLTPQPGDFDLSLSNQKVKEFMNASLKEVALLREAGDIAIKRGDRETMYYIAGKLLVLEHWVQGIYYSKNPGFLSLGRLNLVSPAMAKFTGFTAGVVHRGPRCIVFSPKGAYVPLICPQGHSQTPISFSKIMHAAVEYAEAKPAAEETWDKAWDEANLIGAEKGQIIPTGGVFPGEPDLPPQLSQTEKAFVDECKAKGGTVGGTGGVYARLPTTDIGTRCHYNHNGNSCWDVLSRTNHRCMGGNPGCPEQGLLPPPRPKLALPTPKPKPTPTPNPTPSPAPAPTPTPSPTPSPAPTPEPTPEPTSWDGTYSLTQSGSCGASELGTIFSGVFPSTLSVQGNTVSAANWGSAPISSSGDAQLSINTSYSGVSVSGQQTFHFYSSGGQAMVQGKINISAASVSCQIDVSGSRD